MKELPRLYEILALPQTLNEVHQSCFRSYHILNLVMLYVELDTPKEVIFQIVGHLSEPNMHSNKIKKSED